MRTMKKGDPVVIIGYCSILMSAIVTENCEAKDMNWHDSIASCDNGWVISPSDCFLVDGVKGTELYKEGDPIRKKVLNAAERLGYYWKIILETKVPARSSRTPRKD